MRGEHCLVYLLAHFAAGSSPHARGTLMDENSNTDEKRFIPACAGNTAESIENENYNAVHPRMRGEHRYLTESK